MAAASVSIATDTCNARTRSGGRCRLRAGFGTANPGVGSCKFHGGCTPNGEKHAARLISLRLGAELALDPNDALLLMVRRAAAAERFWAEKVADLDDDAIVIRHVRERSWAGNGENGTGGGTETITESHSDVSVWVREHQRAVDQLARIAKTAIDAGVEERRVRLAEQLTGDLANAFDLLLTRLGVRDHPDAPAAVRAALHLVEAPKQLEEAG